MAQDGDGPAAFSANVLSPWHEFRRPFSGAERKTLTAWQAWATALQAALQGGLSEKLDSEIMQGHQRAPDGDQPCQSCNVSGRDGLRLTTYGRAVRVRRGLTASTHSTLAD